MEATQDFREFGHVLYIYLNIAMDKENELTKKLIENDSKKYKDKPIFYEDHKMKITYWHSNSKEILYMMDY